MRIGFHHDARIRGLIALAAWESDAVDLTREPIGGTNTSYFVEYKGAEYVMRLAASDADVLSINRSAEHEVLKIASSMQIGAPLICFAESNGDMVTLVQPGRIPSADDIREPENLVKLAATLRTLHRGRIEYGFTPSADVEKRLRYLETHGPSLLQGDLYFRAKAAYDAVLAEPPAGMDDHRFSGLCHNDPCVHNMLLSDKIVLIDYEFAGMGNVFFDIASVCGLWDQDSQGNFLHNYFGHFDDRHLTYIRVNTVVQLFWNAAWGYVKTCSESTPVFDYKAWADKKLSLLLSV